MKFKIADITNLNLINKFFLFIVLCFPLILILRSFAINLVTITASVVFLLFFFKKIKTDLSKNSFLIYLFVFFFFILINSIIKNQEFNLILKSIVNYRYLILAIIVYIVFDSVSEKLKIFIIYFNICLVVIVGMDIIYQYNFEKNIFGFLPAFCDDFGKNCVRFSGIFNQELIAGAYLSQVGLLFFFILNKKNQKSSFNYKFNYFFLAFLFSVILLTGERNALLVFLLSIFFYYIFQKKYLKFIKFFLLFFILFIIFAQKFNSVNNRFVNVVNTWGDVYHEKKSTLFEKIKDNPWSLHYQTAIELFLQKPITGHGIKSFRILCKETNISKELIKKKSRYSACSTHPHNYFLEFLSEQGLIGGVFFIGLILGIVIKIFRSIKNDTNESIVVIGLGALILSILFPLKPSGSFFSTFNASLLFYIIGFFLCYSKKIK